MMKNTIRPFSKTEVGAYVTALINQPWARDGRHCWRLVREVQMDLFGLDLPAVLEVAPGDGVAGQLKRLRAFKDHRHLVVECDPRHGAIVFMRKSGSCPQNFEHAGVYLDIDGGGVLHTSSPHGVVFDSLVDLSARMWAPSFFLPKTSI